MATAKSERKPQQTLDVAQSEFVEQIPDTVASLRMLAREDQVEGFATGYSALRTGTITADNSLRPFFDRFFLLNGPDQLAKIGNLETRCWHEACLKLSRDFRLAILTAIDPAVVLTASPKELSVDVVRDHWATIKSVAGQYFVVQTVLEYDGTKTPLGKPADYLDYETTTRLSLNVRKERLVFQASQSDNGQDSGQPAADTQPHHDQPAKHNGWLSCDDIANAEKLPRDALDKRLMRFRRRTVDGWTTIESVERKPRGPKYLYKLTTIQSIIDDMKAKLAKHKRRPPSAERLARKISLRQSS